MCNCLTKSGWQHFCSKGLRVDESACMLHCGKEGLVSAYKFEMQLYLLIYCDKCDVAVQLLRALSLYPEGQGK